MLRSHWTGSARSAKHYHERPCPQPQQQFIPLEPNSIRKKEENTMKSILKPGSIASGFGLMLTTLGQAQPGAPSGTPHTFKVPPHALSAISFSTTPNVQCSVAPAHGKWLKASLHGLYQRRRDGDLLCDAVARIVVRRAACRHLLFGEPTDDPDTARGGDQTVSCTSSFERSDERAVRLHCAPRSYGRPNGSFRTSS